MSKRNQISKALKSAKFNKKYGAARQMYSRLKKAGRAVPKLEGPQEYVDWHHVYKVNQAARARRKVALVRNRHGHAFDPKFPAGHWKKGQKIPHYIDPKTGYTDFKYLKEIGDYGEERALKMIKSLDNSARSYWTIDRAIKVNKLKGSKTLLKRSDWDLAVQSGSGWYKYEVKTQLLSYTYTTKSLKTKQQIKGSVNVELFQNGKKAGLNVSKADLYVFVDDKKGVGFITTEKLKSLVDKLEPAYTDARNVAQSVKLPHDELRWYK